MDDRKRLAAAAPARPAKPKPKSSGASRAAIAALDEELAVIRSELQAIVAELRAGGYVFVGEPLVDPAVDHATRLAELVQRVGAVPVSLARFWAIVGAIDLRGNHPAWSRPSWRRSAADEPLWHTDPVVICTLDAAVREANDSDHDIADASTSRYELAIAGEAVAKANCSGGSTTIRCGDASITTVIQPYGLPLLDYLRTAVLWGGFPGFATIPARPVGYPRPSKSHAARAPRRRR